MAFMKATRSATNLRIAMFGPAGSGKTYSSIVLAKGLAEKKPFAVIDTESGNSQLYADMAEFDVLTLDTPKVDDYNKAIALAAREKYPVLVIDSLTHEWQACLDLANELTHSRYSGNSMRSWAEVTPIHKAFVANIMSYPGYVIATMRTKTDWSITKGIDGKTQVIRMGLSPEQGKDIEYEFSVLFTIDPDGHEPTCIKDNALLGIQDEHFEAIDEKFAKMILDRHKKVPVRETPKPKPVEKKPAAKKRKSL